MKIDTGTLVGQRNWIVQVDYKLKGMFETKKEAQSFIKQKEIKNAEIRRIKLVGIKSGFKK